MATESTGAANRDRTLALLWRHKLGDPRGSRGRKPRVTVDAVVEAAISIADDDGLDALSIRSVAERLGLGTMSLYTYVESKNQLVELMLDEVTARLPMHDTSGTWRDRLTRSAHDELEGYLRHPWMLQVDATRPPLGPGTSDWYEYALAPLDGIGLTDLEMDAALATLGGLVAATARSSIKSDEARKTSGQTDTEWWEANLPVLEEVMTENRWPVGSRVGQTVGEAYQVDDRPARLLRVRPHCAAGRHRVADPPAQRLAAELLRGPGDRIRRAHEGEVRERLRGVARLALPAHVVLLAQQPDVVRERRHSRSISRPRRPARPERAYCSTSQNEHARNGFSPGGSPSTPVSVR